VQPGRRPSAEVATQSTVVEGGLRTNRKVVWLIWTVTALVAIWILLYVVGFYFGDVGD
jgi:hypothetical protein